MVPPVAACPPLAPIATNPAEAPAVPPDPPTDWAWMPNPPTIPLVRYPLLLTVTALAEAPLPPPPPDPPEKAPPEESPPPPPVPPKL